MRRSIIIMALCLLTSWTWAQEFQKTTSGIKTTISGKQTDIEIQWFGPNTLRVLKTPQGKSVKKESLSVIAQPQNSGIKITTPGNGCIVMKSQTLTVILNPQTGIITYAKPNGDALLIEQENVKAFTPVNDAGRSTYSVYQGFTTSKEEGLYGLGQLQNGQMMQRGMTKHLVQGNVEDVSPFFQSTKGYGVFWDNYSGTTYTDNEQETSFCSEVGDCIDYYFMYGGSADGVIAEVRALTGDVPMMPLWSYGFMQSKERYKSQEETVGVVKKYRELGIPLDCIIQDWQYWGHNYLWNAMDFQNPAFSRPKDMIDEVHALNARMMISIWSSFGPATKPTELWIKKDYSSTSKPGRNPVLTVGRPTWNIPPEYVYMMLTVPRPAIFIGNISIKESSNLAWTVGGWTLLNRITSTTKKAISTVRPD